jgi:hypothetical protein
MTSKELEMRRRASVVVSKMMLICVKAMIEGYVRHDNIGAIFPEILVAMAIRVNDDRHAKPMSIMRITKVTGMPRANVQRFLKPLVRNQVVAKCGGGYVGHDAFLQARVNARYFLHMIAAIRAAAKALT